MMAGLPARFLSLQHSQMNQRPERVPLCKVGEENRLFYLPQSCGQTHLCAVEDRILDTLSDLTTTGH